MMNYKKMLHDNFLNQILNLRLIIKYIINNNFINDLNIDNGDLDELDYYLFQLEKSLT